MKKKRTLRKVTLTKQTKEDVKVVTVILLSVRDPRTDGRHVPLARLGDGEDGRQDRHATQWRFRSSAAPLPLARPLPHRARRRFDDAARRRYRNPCVPFGTQIHSKESLISPRPDVPRRRPSDTDVHTATFLAPANSNLCPQPPPPIGNPFAAAPRQLSSSSLSKKKGQPPAIRNTTTARCGSRADFSITVAAVRRRAGRSARRHWQARTRACWQRRRSSRRRIKYRNLDFPCGTKKSCRMCARRSSIASRTTRRARRTS